MSESDDVSAIQVDRNWFLRQIEKKYPKSYEALINLSIDDSTSIGAKNGVSADEFVKFLRDKKGAEDIDSMLENENLANPDNDDFGEFEENSEFWLLGLAGVGRIEGINMFRALADALNPKDSTKHAKIGKAMRTLAAGQEKESASKTAEGDSKVDQGKKRKKKKKKKRLESDAADEVVKEEESPPDALVSESAHAPDAEMSVKMISSASNRDLSRTALVRPSTEDSESSKLSHSPFVIGRDEVLKPSAADSEMSVKMISSASNRDLSRTALVRPTTEDSESSKLSHSPLAIGRDEILKPGIADSEMSVKMISSASNREDISRNALVKPSTVETESSGLATAPSRIRADSLKSDSADASLGNLSASKVMPLASVSRSLPVSRADARAQSLLSEKFITDSDLAPADASSERVPTPDMTAGRRDISRSTALRPETASSRQSQDLHLTPSVTLDDSDMNASKISVDEVPSRDVVATKLQVSALIGLESPESASKVDNSTAECLDDSDVKAVVPTALNISKDARPSPRRKPERRRIERTEIGKAQSRKLDTTFDVLKPDIVADVASKIDRILGEPSSRNDDLSESKRYAPTRVLMPSAAETCASKLVEVGAEAKIPSVPRRSSRSPQRADEREFPIEGEDSKCIVEGRTANELIILGDDAKEVPSDDEGLKPFSASARVICDFEVAVQTKDEEVTLRRRRRRRGGARGLGSVMYAKSGGGIWCACIGRR